MNPKPKHLLLSQCYLKKMPEHSADIHCVSLFWGSLSCVADVFLSSAVKLRLSLQFLVRGYRQPQGVEQKVGGSGSAALFLVKGRSPFSPGFGLIPDKFSEKTGTS